MKLRQRFSDVSLFWKVLVPFLSLVVLIGVLGSFLTVRTLSTQAQAELDQALLRDSLEARSFLHDREFFLLEAANFAANVEGAHAAMRARDAGAVERLMRSVIALKPDLDVLVTITSDGRSFVGFEKPAGAAELRVAPPSDLSNADLVQRALRKADASLEVGIVDTAGAGATLAVAAPICTGTSGCNGVGVAVAGLRLDTIVDEARARLDLRTKDEGFGVALYDGTGERLAADGLAAPAAESGSGGRLVRRRMTVEGRDAETLFAPFELGETVAGYVAVSRPTDAAFASARSAGRRLALLVLVAMLGVVAVGAVVTRRILRQVRPLVAKHRAFGEGDLAARAPVVSGDEIGELATGFNQMADRIQADYEQLERRVEERTAEIRRLLQQRTEFFTGVSHEFRTALAVIRGEAALLTDPTYARTGKERAEVAKTLAQASVQLRTFVDDVLELARAEAGGLEIETTDVDTVRVLKELRPAAHSLTRASELDLEFHVDGRLPHVRANAQRLRDVLLGLIDNAVKYTPSGGRLAVGAEAQNGELRFHVTDTGPGIPNDVGDHVFDAFYTVKGTPPLRGTTSTGLGLAIAKHAVEAQGGRIWFESEPGNGTTFSVAFPVVRTSRARRAPRQPTRS